MISVVTAGNRNSFMNLYYAGKLTNKKRTRGLPYIRQQSAVRHYTIFIDDSYLHKKLPVIRQQRAHHFTAITSSRLIAALGSVMGRLFRGARAFRQLGNWWTARFYYPELSYPRMVRASYCTQERSLMVKVVYHKLPRCREGQLSLRLGRQLVCSDRRYGTDLRASRHGREPRDLISVAHPDFGEDLIQEAEKMGIWRSHKNKVNIFKVYLVIFNNPQSTISAGEGIYSRLYRRSVAVKSTGSLKS